MSAGLLAACTHVSEMQQPSIELTAQQKKEIERVVSFQLKDPDSAKFGPVRVGSVAGSPAVCGWVNAKNSFGAYAGSEIYYARFEDGRFNAAPPGETSRVTCMLMNLLPPQA